METLWNTVKINEELYLDVAYHIRKGEDIRTELNIEKICLRGSDIDLQEIMDCDIIDEAWYKMVEYHGLVQEVNY